MFATPGRVPHCRLQTPCVKITGHVSASATRDHRHTRSNSVNAYTQSYRPCKPKHQQGNKGGRAMTDRADETGPPETLAARLNKLFASVRKPGGAEYSQREVAEGVTELGEPISHSYVGQLRKGEKDNPTLRHLRGLARFFGVPVEYFTNDDVAAQVDLELDKLRALQALRVRTAAMRA